MTGTVRIDGPARRMAGVEPRDIDARFHDWTPLTGCAAGECRLRVGARTITIAGRAYHDRNGSETPFDRLGISEWVWGRAALPDRELLWFLLWPSRGEHDATFVGAEIDRDGRTRVLEELTVRASGARRARFGMRWWKRLELSHAGRPWLDVEHAPPVDDGPFYLRGFVRARAPEGTLAVGTGEVCVPSRVDRDLERPLVAMRVHRVGATSSRWLPLFSGPREGRLARLVLSLAARDG